MIVGVDEAGRGPLAGAVVACALGLKDGFPFEVKDSKALSKTKREEVFFWLMENAQFSVGMASALEIDKLNILSATFLAFERAIELLVVKFPYFKKAEFIIDGNIFRTTLKIKYKCIKKADTKIKEVACASIIAKVTRDYFMNAADFLYPQWKFKQHKGYPTAEHFSLLSKNKITPLHRKSFSPCFFNK